MMIRKFIQLLAIVFVTNASAQNVAINTNGTPPHPTAILDLSSNDKGLLIPRMTTTEREAILNPATGLIVFDTDSRGLWYYASGWQKFVSGGDMGDAGGDLTGQYPEPLVVKLQGHNVSALTPQDKQVLKWDMSDYMWKGMNDSLTLPFVASHADPDPLFSVTNAFNGFSINNLAILGRRQSPSGIGLTFPAAIWGDAYVGVGLVGTSHYHSGVYGQSEQDYGVFGTSNGGWTKAGVYGFGSGGAAGVRGEIEDASYAVHGKATGADATAGRFENTYALNDYPALIATTSGQGSAVEISSTNPASTGTAVTMASYGYGKTLEVNAMNTQSSATAMSISTHGIGKALEVYSNNLVDAEPAVHVSALGTGHGINIAHSGSANTIGLKALHDGSGMAIYGRSHSGPAAQFEITHEGNTYPVLEALHAGKGTGISIQLLNAGSPGQALNAFTNGYGQAIYGRSEFGTVAKFENLNIGNLNPALAVTNAGTGNVALIESSNTMTYEPTLRVNYAGNGHGIRVEQTKTTNTFAALSVSAAGNRGIEVVCNGLYGITASTSADGATGISGITGQTANNAIGVKGATGASVSNGIGVLGEAGVNDPFGFGVKGVAGYVGVYGETKSQNGIGIWGRTGSFGKSGTAAQFQNLYSGNNQNVVEILTNGVGKGLYVSGSNASNAQPMIHVKNAGSGPFIEFEDQSGSTMTVLSDDGDMEINGNLKVRGNKGIVRSTGTNQLRVETISAVFDADEPYEWVPSLGYREVELTFSAPFSSEPVVYIANLQHNGNVDRMVVNVINVTTSGCTLHFVNPTANQIAVWDSTWKLVAMGEE